MSTSSNTFSMLAAAMIAGSASAGMLTLNAASPTGSDNWAGLTGYSMQLVIDCTTLDAAGSAATFTLNAWDFKAWDGSATLAFHATGSDSTPTISPDGTKFAAVIGLSTANILVNGLSPQADSIAFTYAFEGSESLNNAIVASQNTSNGLLQLGNDSGITGILAGSYAVPAPGAAVLVGFGALMARRRRA